MAADGRGWARIGRDWVCFVICGGDWRAAEFFHGLFELDGLLFAGGAGVAGLLDGRGAAEIGELLEGLEPDAAGGGFVAGETIEC